MAISNDEKIDFLWKRVVYGTTKTAPNSAKDGPNETIASPTAVYAHQIWAQADSTNIPSAPPVEDTAVVKFLGGANRVALTADPTAPANRSWLASGGDFIPPTFGSGYLVKVYLGDPNAGKAARIYPGTNNEEYVFDYVAGVLNFVANIPTGKPATIGTGTCNIADGVYIEVYKYTGMKGGSTAKSLVVADIAERDALANVAAGDTVHVRDASGIPTDARAGEYANYIHDGVTWKLLSTQDSARTDSLTSRIEFDFESVSGSLGYVGNGARVVSIVVEVENAFDGDLALSVGDAVDADRLMAEYENDLQESGAYVTNPSFTFNPSAETELLMAVTGTATMGSGAIIITYA